MSIFFICLFLCVWGGNMNLHFKCAQVGSWEPWRSWTDE